MMQRHRLKRNKAYQIKKTGIKDTYIDKQILILHIAIANKLLNHPELIDSVKQT